METLKERYDEIVSERNEIIGQINALAENEEVKEYFALCKQNDILANRQKDLYKQIKIQEYSSCSHIWVTTFHDYDRWEGRSHNYRGCIKCGLDQRVFNTIDGWYNSSYWLSLGDRIMYDFMNDYQYGGGIDTKVLCDLDLAKAIYSKIKEVHPDIDDETAIKYFEIALNNIRNIKVSEERKENRAKRLSLNPDFNKWNGRDVTSY